jgi:N,N-dimethylformamidase beta subunit-like, C-terminal
MHTSHGAFGSGPRSARRTSWASLAVIAATIAGLVGPAAPASAATKYPRARWLIDENRRPGTTRWRIDRSAGREIEGYTDKVSAQHGGRVGLYVSATSRWHVEAYRIGFYGGRGGRLLWTSAQHRGVVQAGPVLDPTTHMVDAPWRRSMAFEVPATWPAGNYLLKLVAIDGSEFEVPFLVRDDTSHAAVEVVDAVTTWQAYNVWGGYDLYHGPGPDTGSIRSRVVTFDRPYANGHKSLASFGSGGYEMIQFVERMGLDVTYSTDVDLDLRPATTLHHRAVVFLGHDEYWSQGMRDAILAARDGGANVAIFGGNTGYRHIRFASSRLGHDRHVICYKVATEDPLYGVNNAEVTTQWRNGPVSRPESAINGSAWDRCFGVSGDMVASVASSWLFRGTGLAAGDRIPSVMGREWDNVHPSFPTPDSIQILSHSPMTCPAGSGETHYADITYYTTQSGAGVLNIGSTSWLKETACSPVLPGTCDARVERITENVLELFAQGPAGVTEPSHPNLGRFGISLQDPISI